MKLLVVLSFILTSVAHAVEITVGAAVDAGLATSNGTDLGIGCLVRIGTFTIDNTQIAANANNLSYLDSVWVNLGTTVIGAGNPAGSSTTDPANAGLFTATFSGVDTTSLQANSVLYYWAFDASSMGSATEHGIFSSTTWTIATGNGSIYDSAFMNTDVSDLTTNGGSPLASSGRVVVGSLGAGTNASGGGIDLQLAAISAIPEPAETAFVCALGSLAALYYRRRRSTRR
jgi:hypothetical protein